MAQKRAIVRKPSKDYTRCITSHPLGHTVSLDLALVQHNNYCKTLTNLGLEIIDIPPKEGYPDACFVEDNAVVHEHKGFITRMFPPSRRGEEDEVEMVLKEYLSIKRAISPATIEGGDVVHLPDKLICGITQRTNQTGVNQMRNWFDINIDTITNPDIVHLKSYMKYLGRKYLITTEEYQNHPLLKGLNLIIIPKDEYYSVNCLSINDTVIMSDKFSYAQRVVKEADFEVISLNMSEFEKCQASLTCLSIIF